MIGENTHFAWDYFPCERSIEKLICVNIAKMLKSKDKGRDQESGLFIEKEIKQSIAELEDVRNKSMAKLETNIKELAKAKTQEFKECVLDAIKDIHESIFDAELQPMQYAQFNEWRLNGLIVRIPAHSGHPFRLIPATYSGPFRPSNPE